jgi:nitrite reductase/ring-hydroxylating ferredoxin subunit
LPENSPNPQLEPDLPMREKIFACQLSEISPSTPVVFNCLPRRQIVIFQTDFGYVALENRCPHAGAYLHEGQLNGNILTCHLHGWSFDLESGQCLNEYWARLTKYGIQIEGEKIYLLVEE